ncbi:MAG: bifunctional phosphoglucose/phosphomannose isomerase [Candidatus Kryptonium sp.]
MLSISDIRNYDKSDMFSKLVNFAQQVSEAVKIGEGAKVNFSIKKINKIVLTGLGGSAIAGDLLRSYLSDEIKVPIIVNRDYFLSKFVDENTLLIVSSYSGNTEETISAYNDGIKKKAKIICITSNGEVEKIALRKKHPVIKIPSGYPPRTALAYSFFPILIVLSRLGFVKNKKREINEAIKLIEAKSKIYSNPEHEENLAYKIAVRLVGSIPFIYTSTKFDAVAMRWACQIEENSKMLAHFNILPELNHNEIVGWSGEVEGSFKEILGRISVVILRDDYEYERVKYRIEITDDLIRPYAGEILNIYSEGKTMLARLFSQIYLGDWVSFYLAILNKVDPTPVKPIEYLKSELAKI